MQKINYATETIASANNNHEKKVFVIVNPENLVRYTEIICTDKNCKYPQLALRILNHIFAEMNKENKWTASARQISKRFDVHYDTVTKCLKYLRSINILQSEKDEFYHS